MCVCQVEADGGQLPGAPVPRLGMMDQRYQNCPSQPWESEALNAAALSGFVGLRDLLLGRTKFALRLPHSPGPLASWLMVAGAQSFLDGWTFM